MFNLIDEKLNYEEQLFMALAEQSSDIIVFLNRKGVITYANPAVERTLGFKVEERIGASGFERIHPDNLKSVTDAFNTLIRDTNAPAQQLEIRLCHRDGRWHMFESVANNLLHNNVVKSVIVNIRDITERKQIEDSLRKSEENFRHSLDDSPLGVRIVTADGEIIYANKAILDIYGYDSIEELKKTPRKERYTPESYAEFQVRKEMRLRGEICPSEYEISIVRKNGEIRHVHIFRKEIFWNDKKQSQVIYQDITLRRQAEKKLNETLENLRKSIKTTIQVLGTAAEVKDPYTAGHQKRVADLARAIATEMKLPHERIEGIRMAGAIHDIGKISIPSEIMCKPSKLTDLEFSLMKAHAQYSYDIMKDVESPWPLADIVYQHHERINGSGYPQGLKGEDILIEARILAVADVVEARTSHRPYRPAYGLEIVLSKIEHDAGILYDNYVVNACLNLFREKNYQLP
jgi:PAS domain S-box-containing protein